ncbi:MAG: MFS transporter [Anaerolineae bacterium]|jgi:predicted MFS family arabinose efflux permease
MDAKTPSPGITTFSIVLLGQFVSLVGSGITSFALGVWTFEQTGSATHFALIGLCAVLPRVVLSPLAGAIVDRWDRRRAMILSDLGAGLTTLCLFFLLLAGQLQIWHIYLLTSINASFATLQWPAFLATTALLVPKQHLGRANGLVQLGGAVSDILAPALAGALVGSIHLQGIILIDFVTFGLAVFTLLLVRFPAPKAASDSPSTAGSLRRDLTFGWKYISTRPGLLGLLVFFAIVNFLWGMVGALITPMILGWTSSDVLGMIIAIAGAGMLAGSLLMSIWGGPKRRINGVLHFELLGGACFILMGLSPSFWPVAAGAFGAHVTIAIVYGSNQAIWQTKVAPDVQGRVFATQQMVARAAAPLAYLLAGPLADRVFDPLLAPGGPLAGAIGQVLGVGPGRGIGLIFVLMGLVLIVITLIGRLNPRIRHVEDELPDAIPAPIEA